MAHFTIDSKKLEAVVKAVQNDRPDIAQRTIEEFVTADWPEGKEHQQWLDNASVQHIADWVIAGQ